MSEFQSSPGPFDKGGSGKADEIALDEIALDEYKQLVHAARSHGAKLVGLIPPIYSEAYIASKDNYDNYFKLISELFLPDERIINFNLPLYSKYTDDVSNFQDIFHLSRKGAEVFSLEFASQIDGLL
jgi:dihydrodipicolinate synthase/N-acetylneuraminate lyase